MATTVVETIGSGGDFADISSWVAALPSDLVSADEVRIGELIDAADYSESSTIDISGITTDATRYVELRAASGVRHNGTGDASGARYAYTGGGHAFTVGIDHFRTRWIDYSYPSGGGSSDEMFRWSGVGEFRVEHCLGHDIDGASDQDFLYPSAGSGTREIRVSNCLFWNLSRAALHNQSEQDITWYVYNVACWNCRLNTSNTGAIGFSSSPNTNSVMVCKNVYAHTDGDDAFFDDDANGDFTGSTNNASYDASAPGTNALTNQDPSTDVDFVSLSGTIDLHIQSGSSLEDGGVDLSGDADYPISTDIDGETRSGTWDIGADELVSGSGPTVLQPSDQLDPSDAVDVPRVTLLDL